MVSRRRGERKESVLGFHARPSLPLGSPLLHLFPNTTELTARQ